MADEDFHKFWGWIPHLYPSIDMKYPVPLFQKILEEAKDGECLFDDWGGDKDKHRIKIAVSDFKYDSKCTRCCIYGPKNEQGSERLILEADVTFYQTGLVCFEVEKKTDDDDKEKRVRSLYIYLKNIFHEDVHHNSDGNSDGDEQIGIVAANSMPEAIKELMAKIIRICNEIQSMVSEDLHKFSARPKDFYDMPETTNERIDLAYGLVAYGTNFANVLCDGEKHRSYTKSLECCSLSIKSTQNLIEKIQNRGERERTGEHQKKLDVLNRNMIFLMVISIGVAFFAGSLLADSLKGLPAEYKGVIVLSAAVVTCIACLPIWRKRDDPQRE
ncbi:MAG: hypothetical protein LBG62_02915 [Candidatus Methanoplasma sp.]|jgi:hypothetical protein|nr:hypothetical protein [Candidatus Methanoplasma sp.]